MNDFLKRFQMDEAQIMPAIRWMAEQVPGGFFVYHNDEKQELIFANSICYRLFGCEDEAQFRQLTGFRFRGLGYKLIGRVEDAARARGYGRMYLETHTNLQAAMHIYEKSGYQMIDKPEAVVHATMNRFFLKHL